MTSQTMPTTTATNRTVASATSRDSSPWLRLSIAAAALAAVGSAVGLTFVESIYGKETDAFADQAIAQDIVNLFVVAPLMAYFAWRALRGSLAAYLAWLGLVTFTVYNYAIYTFSIHFGPLFLLWVAVFGASVFSLIGGGAALDTRAVADAFASRRARGTAGFLLGAATLFALLWLSDVVPALLDGTAPQVVTDVALPTNPVHVLDLAILLPAVLWIGSALWRHRPTGYAGAPAMLLFLALTGLPVITTVFVSNARGNDAAWQLLLPIGTLTVAALTLTWRMLHGLDRSAHRPA